MAQPARQCPADRTLARLISASDLILTARLAPNTGTIIGAVAQSDYVAIPLEVQSVFKDGDAPERLALRHYVERGAHPSSSEALAAASGRSSTFFLTVADGAHYLAAALPNSIRDGDEAMAKLVRTELARQAAILKHWRVDRRLPHFAEVGRLIRRLGSGSAERQRETFAALEKLGEAAVPAIVAQMDDRRPLVEPAISLVNHAPDAFEGIRHYGPEQVVDALAAILNQVSGASFGFIYNGGWDAERRAAVDGWRVYAADLACPRDGASSG